MKIVALEEHWMTPEVRRAWAALPPELQDDSLFILDRFNIAERLEDTDDERLRRMDEVGVDVQVLSLTVPGVHNFDADQSVLLARHANDAMAEAIRAHPDRYQGFAALPTPDPERAAVELERAIVSLGFKGALLHGRTRERKMDEAEFHPIYAAAQRLDVPIYIHPQLPVKAVRDAYYAGLPQPLDVLLAGGGLGWHYDCGLQFVRLVLSGTIDRFPKLQFILGHWGEVVLFYLDRLQKLDFASRLDRPIRDYFLQNAYYTPSGIQNQNYLQNTVRTVGAERVMFSTDYPYEYSVEAGVDPAVSAKWMNSVDLRDGGARRFLEQADVSQVERELIAHGNWDRLTAGLARAAA